MRPGEVLEVTVEKAVYRGLGLARHDGQVVFVPRGHPGDRLRVRVESVTRGYVRATVEAVEQGAAERRAPPCPLFERCGGCAYQHLGLEAQLQAKEAVLLDALRRAGVRWDAPVPVVRSPEEAWRTRATFHLQSVEGRWRLGLHEEGSHRVVDIERCLQLSPAMNRAQRALLAALADHPHWVSRVSEVELAESTDGQALVAALATDMTSAEAAILAPLADAAPWLTGLVAWTRGDRSARSVVLRGSPFVEAQVAGLRLRAHVGSFFQANRFLIEDLVGVVREWTPPGGTLLDLYTGVGLFALTLAPAMDEVLGLEVNPLAVEDARANAQRARFRHVRIEAGDVRRALGGIKHSSDERVVLDPPRTGAGPEVARLVAARRPQAVVYVSCDPPTLARDLVAFDREGYRLDALRAFDLFPDTFHVETVARLLPS